jgi:hypothetical protein
VVVGTLATLVCHSGYILSTFLPSYATTVLGTPDQIALMGLILASVVGILVLLVTGLTVRDRDPRPVALLGAALVGICAFPAFLLAEHAGSWGLILGVTGGLGVLMVHYAVLPVLLTALFPVAVRYTGISLCFQFSAVIGGGLLPIAASNLVAGAAGHYAPAAGLVMGAAALSCLGALLCWSDDDWGALKPGATPSTAPSGRSSGAAATPR